MNDVQSPSPSQLSRRSTPVRSGRVSGPDAFASRQLRLYGKLCTLRSSRRRETRGNPIVLDRLELRRTSPATASHGVSSRSIIPIPSTSFSRLTAPPVLLHGAVGHASVIQRCGGMSR